MISSCSDLNQVTHALHPAKAASSAEALLMYYNPDCQKLMGYRWRTQSWETISADGNCIAPFSIQLQTALRQAARRNLLLAQATNATITGIMFPASLALRRSKHAGVLEHDPLRRTTGSLHEILKCCAILLLAPWRTRV